MSRISVKTRDDLPATLRRLWDRVAVRGAAE